MKDLYVCVKMTGDIVALMALEKAEVFADYCLKVP